MISGPVRLLVSLVFALALAPATALAHGPDHSLEDQLVKDGAKLVIGKFTAPQPGPLIVVPYVDEAPPCAGTPTAGAVLPLGDGAYVTFFVAADGLHALLDLPADPTGYAAIAVDTHDAQRALILMAENAIALHALRAVVFKDGRDQDRSGVLGLPYLLPGEVGHAMNYTPEGGGIVMDHDDSFRGSIVCAGDVPGHRAFAFNATALPESVTPGRVVHVVALYDPEVPFFLPRPLDESTRVLQANLYLARPGEDPVAVREAFSPRWVGRCRTARLDRGRPCLGSPREPLEDPRGLRPDLSC